MSAATDAMDVIVRNSAAAIVRGVSEALIRQLSAAAHRELMAIAAAYHDEELTHELREAADHFADRVHSEIARVRR